MKHLTNEISSQWAAFSCLLDAAALGDQPLSTSMRLLIRGSDQLDRIMTSQLAGLKPEQASKARVKAVKQLHHLEKMLAERIVPALAKKEVCLRSWAEMDEKLQTRAIKE